MIDEIVLFPQITISDMEYQLIKQKILKKKKKELQQLQKKQKSGRDIIVTSPFYKRINQNHHYHHDRYSCSSIKHNQRKSLGESDNDTLRKKTKKKINICQQQTRLVIEHTEGIYAQNPVFNSKLNLKHKFTSYQLLKPIDLCKIKQSFKSTQMLHDKDGEKSLENYQKSGGLQIFSRLTHLVKTQVNKSKITLKTIQQKAECKIDDINSQFLNIIKRRMQNKIYKDQYLTTLFKFIKMKKKEDINYAKNTQGYLENSLNLILNHYSIDQLLNKSTLSQYDLAKIGYFMNMGQGNKVQEVLDDLSKIVHQMQEEITKINLTKRKLQEQKEQRLKQQRQRQIKEFSYLNSSRDKSEMEKYTHQQKHSRNSGNSRKRESGDKENDQSQSRNGSKILSKVSFLKKRGSKITFNLQSSSSTQTLQSRSFQSSQKCINEKKSQHRATVNLGNEKGMYLANDTLETVQEEETKMTNGENEMEEVKQYSYGKKLKKLKTKIFKAPKKNEQQLLLQKFKEIKYQTYFSKEEFLLFLKQYKINEQKDDEILAMLIKYFHLDNDFQSNTKIQNILNDFSSLINQNVKIAFWRYIINLRDKKKIQILERQLDQMLGQIKKNDPRTHYQQFFHMTSKKNIFDKNEAIKCKVYKQVRQNDVDRIIYYEALQQVENHKEKQKKSKLQLEQVQPKSMHFQVINPTLSKIICYTGKEIEKINKNDYNSKIICSDHQKNVLRYMRNNHKNTFDGLQKSITNLCKSLPKEV